jgi:hypothetical protein
MPGLVHVDSYRQRRNGNLVEIAEHARGGTGGGDKPWHGRPHAELRVSIAGAERSAGKPNDGYGEINPTSGALGRYQLKPVAFRDIEWKDADGAWTDHARKHDVDSDSAFLAKPDAQEEAMTMYLKRNDQQLKANESKAHVGARYRGINGVTFEVTEASLAAAAHREGAGATKRALDKLKAIAAGKRQTFTKPDTRAIRRMQNFEKIPYARP